MNQMKWTLSWFWFFHFSSQFPFSLRCYGCFHIKAIKGKNLQIFPKLIYKLLLLVWFGGPHISYSIWWTCLFGLKINSVIGKLRFKVLFFHFANHFVSQLTHKRIDKNKLFYFDISPTIFNLISFYCLSMLSSDLNGC